MAEEIIERPTPRLVSLDFMRGLIMAFLMLESTEMYSHISTHTENTFLHSITIQFFHHPWHGLRFWDLIQPGFMFIAGTALALSLLRQQQAGVSRLHSFIKVLKRSAWLLFFGVLIYAVGVNSFRFVYWNVLAQLSVTTLIAFSIFYLPITAQLIFTAVLLILTEVLYRFTGIPGFDLPFTDQKNFGNYVDLLLMNTINNDGWVAFNCIPTACHTIWGAIAGKLLFSSRTQSEKLKLLLLGALIFLIAGYGLDAISTPIIKRISTSSFVLASGGWCLLALSFFYWWIDVKSHRKYITFFTVVGMNSIFIYLFFSIAAVFWFNAWIDNITGGLLGTGTFMAIPTGIISSAIIFTLEWLMCYYLYKKNIIIKI